MDVGLRYTYDSPVCLSLTGTKVPLSLSPRNRENDRGYAMMRALEDQRRKSLLRARQRIRNRSSSLERSSVDTTVAMKHYYKSRLDTFCGKESERPSVIRSLTDIQSVSNERINQTQHHATSTRSLEDINDSCVHSRVLTTSQIRQNSKKKKKKKMPRRKTHRQDSGNNSLGSTVDRERKPCLATDLLVLRQCKFSRNQLPPISSHELLVQSVVPLSSIEEKRSPEERCKPRGKAKVFLSERQSHMLKYERIPAAPPCTPTTEHLEGHDYIASMSDIRSQRLLKAHLAALEEKMEQQKIKADEEARVLAKKTHLQSIAALKSQQRAEIYALNRLMTELEHENFVNFCEEKRGDLINN